MRKKWVALAAGAVLGTMLSGCSLENQGDLGNRNLRPNTIKYNAFGNVLRDKHFANDGLNEQNRINGSQRISNNLIGNHKNYRLEMSSDIANRIAELDKVHQAYVMLTDYSAYVAVSLQSTDTDLKAQSKSKTHGRTHLGLFNEEGAAAGKRMSSLSTGSDLLDSELQVQVEAIVKEVRPQIANVYVSADPDFVGRMDAYSQDVNAGYPIQYYIMEFNAMVERVFPVAKPNPLPDNGITQSKGMNKKFRLLE